MDENTLKVKDNRCRTDIDTHEVIKLYNNGLTMQQIGVKLRASDWVIKNRLIKQNIPIRPNRKHFFDENTFSQIDEQWKAYFLGFMFADGCIRKDCLVAKLSISHNDKEIIEYFSKKLGVNKVKTYEEKPAQYKKGDKIFNNGRKVTMTLCSKKLCLDLIQIGCKPQKSLTLDWPINIPDMLIPHFVRGYFDGDGSISKNGKSASFVTSSLFAKKLQSYLNKKLNISLKIYPHGNVVRALIFRKSDITKLKLFLYSDAEFYLKRKYERFN